MASTIIQRLASYMRTGQSGMLFLELGIVVVGILIAFQVDRLYEQRQDAQSVASYVERLLANIEDDLAELRRAGTIAENRSRFIDMLESSLTDPEIAVADPDLYIYALEQVTYITPFTTNDSALSELISTGDMGLLPVNLRDELYAYYGLVENRSTMTAQFEIRQQAQDRFAGIIAIEQMKILTDDIRGAPEDEFNSQDAVNALTRLLNTPEAIEWLPRLQASHGSALYTTTQLIPLAESLKASLLQLKE